MSTNSLGRLALSKDRPKYAAPVCSRFDLNERDRWDKVVARVQERSQRKTTPSDIMRDIVFNYNEIVTAEERAYLHTGDEKLLTPQDAQVSESPRKSTTALTVVPKTETGAIAVDLTRITGVEIKPHYIALYEFYLSGQTELFWELPENIRGIIIAHFEGRLKEYLIEQDRLTG